MVCVVSVIGHFRERRRCVFIVVSCVGCGFGLDYDVVLVT